MALPNLVTGSLRSKIDRILAKQVVSTVALHGTKHDTTLHSSARKLRDALLICLLGMTVRYGVSYAFLSFQDPASSWWPRDC